MKRLSHEQREIISSAGVPLLRLLPFALPVLALFLISFDIPFLDSCVLGHAPTGSTRVQTVVRLAAAVLCAPRYASDLSRHGPIVALFVLGIVLAVPQIFWLRKHRAYWEEKRRKDRERRSKTPS